MGLLCNCMREKLTIASLPSVFRVHYGWHSEECDPGTLTKGEIDHVSHDQWQDSDD